MATPKEFVELVVSVLLRKIVCDVCVCFDEAHGRVSDTGTSARLVLHWGLIGAMIDGCRKLCRFSLRFRGLGLFAKGLVFAEIAPELGDGCIDGFCCSAVGVGQMGRVVKVL